MKIVKYVLSAIFLRKIPLTSCSDLVIRPRNSRKLLLIESKVVGMFPGRVKKTSNTEI